jgi:Brp/Blh family beta-carotene 15,15'-monooxygenase
MIIPQTSQTWLFAFSAVVSVAADWILQPDLFIQLLILAPAVAFVGLPHGALDLSIAQLLWRLNGWRDNVCFGIFYIFLTLLVIGLWIVLPGPALFLFLLYSAVHFSGDWDRSDAILRWTGGIATLGAPALFSFNEVAAIFAQLAPETSANLATIVLAAIGAAALAVFTTIMFLRPNLRTGAAIEQAIIWFSAACLSPLVYFVVYFCTLHSVRHFACALTSLDDQRTALRVTVLLSTVTVLGAILAFVILQKSGSLFLEESILRVIFIGLAALTVPHMLLVDRFHHQQSKFAKK